MASMSVLSMAKQEDFAGMDGGCDFALIRDQQEKRLLAALQIWETEKKSLEEAIARCEAKEREFREVQDDVQRRLEALDLVMDMSRQIRPPIPAEQPVRSAAASGVETIGHIAAPRAKTAAVSGQAAESPVRTSWRPLFSTPMRPAAAAAS